jgi:glucose-6-phosphate-specific signal transduction histidine kinase
MTDAPPANASGGLPQYPARLQIAYPEGLNRVTTAFRLILIIPIAIVAAVLTGANTVHTGTTTTTSVSITGALFVSTLLLILFRRRYPRWWFDFALELTRFTTRIGAYLALLTDKYPSTVEHQTVALDLDYPDVERELSRGLPLVKWFLAIPHYIVLFFLGIGAVVSVVLAWFAILFTGRYPRTLFDYVVGVIRWGLRVEAYAFLLITDQYPPFSLH